MKLKNSMFQTWLVFGTRCI